MEPEVARPALRLLIVDDQPLIRRGMAMMLASEANIEVVGQAADGVQAVELALATQPDVVVMDLQMPRASGVTATREITSRLPATHIVVLTTYDNDELVFEAIRAGAHAYLLKDVSEAEVLETIWSVHRGESRLSPAIARKVMEQFRAFVARSPVSSPDQAATALGESVLGSTEDANLRLRAPDGVPIAAMEPLTDKEHRILELIAQGKSNKQIAATVFLAEGTVKNYVSRIMEKLHAENRYQLAARARGHSR